MPKKNTGVSQKKRKSISKISHDTEYIMPDTSDPAEMARADATRNKLTANVDRLRPRR